MSRSAGSLGVAVIGLGVGEQHARAFASHPDCHLRWLYDLDAARATMVMDRIGAGRPAKSLDEVLGDAAVDVVSIASFDDAHFEQTRAALEAGKHVFVEKPLCRTEAESASLKNAWLAAGSPHLCSNLVLRAAPVYVWLRAAIAAGELGEVYAVDGEYLYGRLEKITHGWRAHVPDYSVLLGGGVHLIDLMMWLTGQRPERVSAHGNRICTGGTAFRYDDFAAATFLFPGGRHGLIGRITANFGCVHRHQHIVRVFGTKATFVYDDLGPRLHTTRDPSVGAVALTQPALPATKGDLIPDFVAGILHGASPALAAQHEFDVMSASLAADRAARQQSTEEIHYA